MLQCLRIVSIVPGEVRHEALKQPPFYGGLVLKQRQGKTEPAYKEEAVYVYISVHFEFLVTSRVHEGMFTVMFAESAINNP